VKLPVRFAGRRLAAVLVFLVGAGAYAYSMSIGFAYDDVVIINEDARVKNFLLEPIFSKPYWASPGFALYRPLVTLSFAIDWAVSNGNASWFHAVNSIWHGLVCVALFFLLSAWFGTTASLAGALLFAVHPVHVEAVANIVGRAELMAAVFVLVACACWAYEWPRRRVVRLGLVLLCFAAALLCKESAAVLPGLLVLVDTARGHWNGFNELPRYLKGRAPELLALALVLAAGLVVRAVIAGGLAPTQLDPIMEVLRSPTERIRTALQIWPQFVRLMFFPVTLLADYSPQVLMPAEGWNLSAGAGLLIASAIVLAGLLALERGHGLTAFSLLWFPLTVLPVANLLVPIGILLAERTLYLPSVALSFGAAALVTYALQRWPERRQLMLAGGLAILTLLAIRSNIRIPDWESTDSILLAQLRDRPDSFRAHWHAARIERRANRVESAIGHYHRAVQLWQFRERLIVEAAAYAAQQQRALMAVTLAQHGTKVWPRNAQLHRLLAANALDLGDTATARSALRTGLELAPNDDLMKKMSAAILSGTGQ
jgi:tetratricopeptide (TPR) repeat protein